jgi:hypothetical protein
MFRDEPVERVESGRESKGTKQPAERPGEADLAEEGDASAPVACDRRAIPKHDPPARAPPLFWNCGEQAVGFRVRQGQQRQLLAAVEFGDAPRRPAAELSAARVEQDGARNGISHPEFLIDGVRHRCVVLWIEI